MCARFLCFVVLLLVGFPASASSVWQVSKNNQVVMYLGGTMHILSPDDYPLPPEFKVAYDASDVLVFETDVAAMNTPAFQQKSMQLLTYTDGTSLENVLSSATLAKLKTHLASRNIPFDNLKYLKPSALAITLTVVEFQKMGLTTKGVDHYFFALSTKDNKKQQWLETPEQQLNFIANMGNDDADEMILYSLDDIATLPVKINRLKTAWRDGDLVKLQREGLDSWLNDYPEIHKLMLVDRNNNWMPPLKTMLATPEVEYVLVGALHMVGSSGLIAQLQAAGYKVERLDAAVR